MAIHSSKPHLAEDFLQYYYLKALNQPALSQVTGYRHVKSHADNWPIRDCISRYNSTLPQSIKSNLRLKIQLAKINMSVSVPDNYFHSRRTSSSVPADRPQLPIETYNLFRSFGGIKLPVEVCLRIVEYVVDIDPKVVQVLMCLSKVS